MAGSTWGNAEGAPATAVDAGAIVDTKTRGRRGAADPGWRGCTEAAAALATGGCIRAGSEPDGGGGRGDDDGTWPRCAGAADPRP
jgi:hypothetical protein